MRTLATAQIMTIMTAAAIAGPALAQTRSQVWGGPLTQQAQTVYVTAESGPTTYESDAAGSKETQMSNTFTAGAWAGESRIVGAAIRSSEAEVPFELNDATMKTSFRDVRIMARLGWFIPFATVSLSEVDVTQGDTETVSVYGTGTGAGLAVGVPLHEKLVFQVEGSATQSNQVYDKLGQDTKLGRRDEGDAHLSFDLTDRMVDLLVGYRVRSYEIEAAEEQVLEEKSQGAYAGLRLGLYF